MVQTHPVAGAQRSRPGEHAHPGVETAGDVTGELRRDQPAAALHLVPVEATQIDADPAARADRLGLMIVNLDAADRGPHGARLHHELVAGLDPALPERARDDGADAFERKHAVHRETRRAAAPPRLDLSGGAVQRGEQLVFAAAVAGADGHHLARGVR
jgi:hypothetical protein